MELQTFKILEYVLGHFPSSGCNNIEGTIFFTKKNPKKSTRLFLMAGSLNFESP